MYLMQYPVQPVDITGTLLAIIGYLRNLFFFAFDYLNSITFLNISLLTYIISIIVIGGFLSVIIGVVSRSSRTVVDRKIKSKAKSKNKGN